MNKALVYTQSADHCDRLASLVRQLYPHPLLDPESARGHPQMERSLVNIDDVVLRFLHELLGDVL